MASKADSPLEAQHEEDVSSRSPPFVHVPRCPAAIGRPVGNPTAPAATAPKGSRRPPQPAVVAATPCSAMASQNACVACSAPTKAGGATRSHAQQSARRRSRSFRRCRPPDRRARIIIARCCARTHAVGANAAASLRSMSSIQATISALKSGSRPCGTKAVASARSPCKCASACICSSSASV